ncbi:Phosphoglycolate phosphatase [Burkholderiales bacterium]|nr:Phosphoglycolate phosphatase [Burkholderiales bacterium]
MHTAQDLALAANRVRGEFGLPELDVERVSRFVGQGTGLLVHRALTDDVHGRLDDDSLRRAKAAFERHYREVNGSQSLVFERVPEALLLVREAGLLVGCVTNQPRAFALALLEGAPLLPQLDVVVAGDDVARRKPHPDVILEACARLHAVSGAAILIGDSANDAQAAQAAGCPVVLVETGYNEGESVHGLAGEPGVGGIFPSLLDAARGVIPSALVSAPKQESPASPLRSALP